VVEKALDASRAEEENAKKAKAAASAPSPAEAPAAAAAVTVVPAPAPATAPAPAVAAPEMPMTAKEERLATTKAAQEKASAERVAHFAAQREARERARAEREAKKLVAAEARRAAREVRVRAAAAAATAEPSEIREVGFKQLGEVSRIFVRFSAPPRFSIAEAGERLIRVELQNTRVARPNDTRAFDSSFFPGVVASVTPRRHGRSTLLDIALKEKVAYQQKLEGDTLAIDFERPVALKASAAAAAR
jgi:colicin import membrane protein